MLPEIQPGTLINDRYQIQKVLGQGGFGRTYLAFDNQRFGETCVLKEFVPFTNAEYIVTKSRELFEREAKALYQISHPQIPKFLAWFTEKEQLFLVQEYIDGKTYSQLLWERLSQQNQAFSEPEVVQWLWDMIPILDYIHRRNLIHRDISLDNIMLPNNQSKPVLIDFGVVKEKVTQMFAMTANIKPQSGQGSVIGKIGYAPPEQIRMGQCYPCSDIYALGVSAIVLLTGKTPDALMDSSLEWQWRAYANVSDNLAQVLDKMLAEKPKQRYQQATEILAELPSHNTPNLPEFNLPLKQLQIDIDLVKKEREVAEILESDEFKLIEQKANSLRRKNQINLEDILETKTQKPENFTFEPMISPIHLETASKAETSNLITPEFIVHCQQELSRCIGPMASILIEDTLEQNPNFTPAQLIEALVLAIPHQQRAQDFQQRVQIPIQPQAVIDETPKINNSTSIDLKFIEHCRLEFSRFMGPMASIFLEDTLAETPNLTPKQLVEALAAIINNPPRAKEFRERMKQWE